VGFGSFRWFFCALIITDIRQEGKASRQKNTANVRFWLLFTGQCHLVKFYQKVRLGKEVGGGQKWSAAFSGFEIHRKPATGSFSAC
jgi:hypothetical protein